MVDTLDVEAFLYRCEDRLGQYGLFPIASSTLNLIQSSDAKFAYYFNPHVVHTIVLEPAENQCCTLDTTIGSWCQQIQMNLQQSHTEKFPKSVELSGVPEGRSVHDEMYFEVSPRGQDFLLNSVGKSFRVRVTTSSGDLDNYPSRILMLLTHYPVDAKFLSPLDANGYWSGLNKSSYPAFRKALRHLTNASRSTLIPSVVECFVAYLTDRDQVRFLLRNLEQIASAPDVHPVAKSTKTSTKFDIAPWKQNPISGIMNSHWAYVALDNITLTSSLAASPEFARLNGDHWSGLRQIEVEIGPNSELINQIAPQLTKLCSALKENGTHSSTTFGRKIHRFLSEAGHPFGQAQG